MDSSFALDPRLAVDGNIVTALALQADGRIVIGGGFWTLNLVLRLLPDGRLDETFLPLSNRFGPLQSLALDRDGKILYGETFLPPAVTIDPPLTLDLRGFVLESMLQDAYGRTCA